MLREVTIQLITACNRNCPYCLAPKDNFVSLSETDFETFCAFCRRENIDLIHVTGGEPSLHPRFESIISRLSTISSLVIYSNLCKKGVISPAFRYQESIDVLANINCRASYTDTEWMTIVENIRKLQGHGIRVTFSHTFSAGAVIEEEFDRIFQIMEEMNVNRLRISQALPGAGGVPGMGRREINCLYRYVSEHIDLWEQSHGYRVYFDCPVPPCYLPQPVFERLYARGILGTKCLSKLFVLPDLGVTHCYQTMECKDRPFLTDRSTYDELMAYSQSLLAVGHSLRNVSTCSSCNMIDSKGIPCGCPNYRIEGRGTDDED